MLRSASSIWPSATASLRSRSMLTKWCSTVTTRALNVDKPRLHSCVWQIRN